MFFFPGHIVTELENTSRTVRHAIDCSGFSIGFGAANDEMVRREHPQWHNDSVKAIDHAITGPNKSHLYLIGFNAYRAIWIVQIMCLAVHVAAGLLDKCTL